MAKILLTLQANDKATASVRALNSEAQVLSKTLSSITVNKDLTAQINALTRHYTALANAQSKVTANANKQAISDERLSQQQAITAKKVAEAAAAQARLEKTQQKTSVTTEQLQRKFANLLSTIRNLKNAYPKGTFDEMEQGVRENMQAAKDGTKGVEELGAAYDTLSTKVAVAKAETDKVTTAVVKSGDSIGSLVKKIFLWQVSTTLVMKPLRFLQDLLSSINETLVKTEDAVIALQRVLPSGSATDSEISSRLYKVAQDYGQTFENVSEIATNFARTGMSWADTIKATEAAVLALNVAELDAEEATNGLIAILSQFGLTASDLETVIDELNKTADNFPVTTQKILAALQRTGSAASNANLSLEQTIALITALSKATGRSGENIGTALNSLIQYSSKASALDTFAALSEASEEVVEKFRQGGATILDVWRQVSAEIKNLKADQADLLDQYFSTEDGEALKDALDGELQDIYTELGGVYDTANTFRKNYFIALLGNMDTVEQAMGTLGDAAGYSQSENEKYLNTYTARVNALNAQWEDLVNNEQGWLGFKKGLVNAGSDLLNLIKYTGGLSTTLSAVGTAAVALFGPAVILKIQQFSSALKIGEGTALNLGLRLGNLASAEMNLSFAQDAERVSQEALNAARASGIGVIEAEANAEKAAATVAEASAAKAKASAAAWASALTWVMLILTVASLIDSTIRRIQEKNAERERQAIEDQNAAISASNAKVDAQKKEVQSMEEVAASVEELRSVLDDSTASEEEKRSAQEQLLQIQNTLIDSNNAYKDSLDLTNGSLKEQLGLIEQLTTEQLKQKAQDFLTQNKSQIEIARDRLESSSTTETDMLFSGDGNDRFRFRDMIEQAIQGAGIENIADIIEDNIYGYFHAWGRDIKDGWDEEGLWGALSGLVGGLFADLFTREGWVGSASAGFSFSGTVEEQIKAIEKLRDYISTHREELGLSAEEVVSITTELGKQLEVLNSEDYQQAKLLAERAKATQDFLDGTITEAEYLEKVYGIQKEINKGLEATKNTLESLEKENLQALIDALKKMREEQEESLELEEQKQKVIDAQNALLAEQKILNKANNGTLTLGDLGEADLQSLLAVINAMREEEQLALDIEEKKQDVLEAQNVLAEKQAELTRTQNALRLAQMGITTDLGNYSESALKALADGISDLISAEKLALEIEKKKQEIIDAQNELVEKQNALTKAQNALVAAQRGTIADISDLTENALDALIDGLKRLREEEEDSVELEEKKLAVLEAQRALENAKNERSLRRFNSETGQYEWQVDEKKIADAEESLQSAVEALNEYIENQAWDDVIAELESGNATDASIKSILDKWFTAGLSREPYEKILSGISDLIKSKPVIDALNADFEALQADYDEALQNLKDLQESFNQYLEQKAWEEVKDAITRGNVNDAQIRAILDKWSAEGLPDETYNKIASSIESLKLSQPVIDALNADFEAAQKSYDEANAKVQTAIENLQSYLRDKAWAEIKEAIESGNVDDDSLREILNKWRELGLPQDSYDQIQNTIQKAIGSDEFKGALQETVDQLSQSYNDALSEYEKWLKDKVWKDVISELESGNATNDTIKALLEKWKAESYQDGLPSWYQGIIAAIEKYSGVELSENTKGEQEQGGSSSQQQGASDSQPKTADDYFNALREAGFFSTRGTEEAPFRNGVGRQFSSDPNGMIEYLKELYSHWMASPQTESEFYSELEYWGMSQGQLSNLQRSLANPSLTREQRLEQLKKALSGLTGKSYDKGGVASGIGLMAKETEEDETVLGPDLTKEILSPVSNERFHQFAKDLGLMFETQRSFQPKPIIERVGGNTDNRIDNSGQTIINGVRVGADMMNKPLVEVLRYIKFMM